MSDSTSNGRPRTFIYRIAGPVVGVFFRLFYRVRVEGTEHIPEDGGIIIASNHLSNLDPPLIGLYVTRYIQFMGKEELFRVPVLGRIFAALGGFPIARGKIDKKAIRQAIEIVENGGCLLMFPEGHRSRDGKLGEFMPGVATIARKSRGLVVPTAIIGPYRRFQPLRLRFGEPLATEAFSSSELIAELRTRIEALLQVNEEIS